MVFGNGYEITKEMMPSYQIMQDYPSRQYSFMQDTLNNALQAQTGMAQAMQSQGKQPSAGMQPMQQPGAWNGGAQ